MTTLQLLPVWKSVSQMRSAAAPIMNPPVDTMNDVDNGPEMKARPIQHWRRHTCTDKPPNSYVGIGMPMDRPGGSTILANGASSGSGCKPIEVNINPLDCPKCRPGNRTRRIRSGMTNVRVIGEPGNQLSESDTCQELRYSTTTRELLHKRCLTYEQRLSGQQIKGIDYTSPPSDAPDGSQVRLANECPQPLSADCKTSQACRTIIYKPSNKQFCVQGPVSSSSRIEKLKYNTIQKNAKSFTTAYGAQAANAGRYSASGNTPYFIKSKVNVCQPSMFHINGNKNLKCN